MAVVVRVFFVIWLAAVAGVFGAAPTLGARAASAPGYVDPAPSTEPVAPGATLAVNRDIVFLGVFATLTFAFVILAVMAFGPDRAPRRGVREPIHIARERPPVAAAVGGAHAERRNGHAHALARLRPDPADPASLNRQLAGLEKRFFDDSAGDERDAIITEVEHLRRTHGDDASFAAAADKFLTAAYFDAILR